MTLAPDRSTGLTPRQQAANLLLQAIELLENNEGFGKVIVLLAQALTVMGVCYAMGDQ